MSGAGVQRLERGSALPGRGARGQGAALSARNIRALRRIRAGAAPDAVCREFELTSADLRALEDSVRGVPDVLLARIEGVLRDNEKLRRLVAGLQKSWA